MNKLKAFSSKITSSTPGGKLSKAFKFDKDLNVLKRNEGARGIGSGGDPFHDGPVLEELFFTFLAICTMGGVAGFQAKWVGVSGGTGFTLFILLLSFLLSTFLVLTPLIYDRWDRLKRPAQFLNVPRSTLILHVFGTGMLFLASLIVTISAWTAKGCKDPLEDPHADLGEAFQAGLTQWCTTKRASAIFDWLAFACWAALLVLSALSFHRDRRETRRREPSFIPPAADPYAYGAAGGMPSDTYNYATVNTNAYDEADFDGRYEAEPEPKLLPQTEYVGYDQPAYNLASGAAGAASAHRPVPVSRVSMASFGAGAADGGEGPSRTMQLASNASDPYAAIRSSLMTGQANSYTQVQNMQPATYTYAQSQGQALPNPPQQQYQGYH